MFAVKNFYRESPNEKQNVTVLFAVRIKRHFICLKVIIIFMALSLTEPSKKQTNIVEVP